LLTLTEPASGHSQVRLKADRRALASLEALGPVTVTYRRKAQPVETFGVKLAKKA